MSPRAAWRLESLGFTDVYDFVDGKLEWISHGLPVEGSGPYYAVAGKVADRESVLACHLSHRVGDVAAELETSTYDYCVVLNDRDIVLGRMRKKNLSGAADTPVVEVMEPGPTTVRPSEPAQGLLERMKRRKVPAVLVTTNKGRLLGVATLRALEQLVASNLGARATES